jgi:hypothetical protein
MIFTSIALLELLFYLLTAIKPLRVLLLLVIIKGTLKIVSCLKFGRLFLGDLLPLLIVLLILSDLLEDALDSLSRSLVRDLLFHLSSSLMLL